MARLTRTEDQYVCRIAECHAEEWMEEIYSHYMSNICDNCPFMAIANKLAEYEDKEGEETN